MSVQPKATMNREEFRAWQASLPRGVRYERVAGLPVAMAPERVGHARVKARIWRALEAALLAAGAPCEALPDGVTVEVGDDTDYEPDVVVTCGPPPGDEALTAPNPVIIVEVLSPGTASIDTGGKLGDYFRLPSLRHYLIVRVERRTIILHSRDSADGPIRTSIVTSGRIDLTPPGIAVEFDSLFDR